MKEVKNAANTRIALVGDSPPSTAADVTSRTFYRLRERPFSLLPDPAFFYSSSKHRKALSKLRSGILNGAGTALITGEIGSGKTTLVQHLIRQLESEVTIGLISNTHSKFDDLLEWVLQAFGLPVVESNYTKLHQTFIDFVGDHAALGRMALLFVDEAQNLYEGILEELRLLTNVNVDVPVFQVVLVGQPELRGILQQPAMRQFAQRIAVEHELSALDAVETQNYIRHRLSVAGGDPTLFDAEACKRIYYSSQGIPRLINSLCATVLEYGFEEKRRAIDGALVREILNDGARRLIALSARSPVPTKAEKVPVLAKPNPGNAPKPQVAAPPSPEKKQSVTPKAAAKPVSKSPPAGRPKNLDDALKRLSALLD